MRHLAALLLTTVFGVGLADARDASEFQKDVPLTILYRSDVPIASLVLTAIGQEVKSALAMAGVDVSFEPLTPEPPVYIQTAIIRLRGDCRADARVAPNHPVRDGMGDELGVTHIVDGKILPFADIRCDAVRHLLGKFRGGNSVDRDQILGKALGRVIAHELYHVLADSTTHGRSGLAAAVFNRDDLLAPQRAFAARDVERMAVPGAAGFLSSRIRTRTSPPAERFEAR
jgi:hypothetical protein